jgi:hypothetical protein
MDTLPNPVFIKMNASFIAVSPMQKAQAAIISIAA